MITRRMLNHAKDQKEVYQVASGLLFGQKSSPLPTADSIPELAETFSNYFYEKIKTIREDLDKTTKFLSDNEYKPHVSQLLNEFSPASEAEISKLIKGCASKSCELDSIPTWLLKLCLDELLPFITHFVMLYVTVGRTSRTP